MFEFWPEAAPDKSRKLDRRKTMSAGGSASLELDALNKSITETSAHKEKKEELLINYENSLGLKYDFIINEKYLIVFRKDLKGFYYIDMDIQQLKTGQKAKNVKWHKYYKRTDFSN